MTNPLNIIVNNVWHLPGFRTRRKLIAFVIDDYGSIRTSSCESYDKLTGYGLNLENNRFTRYDTLESNQDLVQLYEVLSSFRDCMGKSPAFTPMVCVANPDFEKIRNSGFTKYYYEPFTETLKRYSDHDQVFRLWKEGIDNRIFVPQFHAREHLNIRRWMTDLQQGVKSTILAFNYGISGIGHNEAKDIHKEYQASFDIDDPDDIVNLKPVIREGLQLFEALTGYKAVFFSPANTLFNHSLDADLKEGGIEMINAGKREKEPLGHGKYRISLHYSYQKNRLGQLYVLRNALFEPNQKASFDWTNRCIHDIATAFRWGKPAIISSHRVNFSGHLVPENRINGLNNLKKLLGMILNKWPDCEFVLMDDLNKICK